MPKFIDVNLSNGGKVSIAVNQIVSVFDLNDAPENSKVHMTDRNCWYVKESYDEIMGLINASR